MRESRENEWFQVSHNKTVIYVVLILVVISKQVTFGMILIITFYKSKKHSIIMRSDDNYSSVSHYIFLETIKIPDT